MLFSNPVKLCHSSISDYYEEIFSTSENKSVALILTRSLSEKLALGELINKGKESCKNFIWINHLHSYPTHKDISKFLLDIGQSKIDEIYAIGGGSAIDLAKCCIAFTGFQNENLINDPQQILEAIKSKQYLNYPSEVQLFVTPTTAGTGSELTKWATVWDDEGKRKYSIEAECLYPNTVYLVPEFTYNLPTKLTISTGLDALCHACEAFWAKSSSPIIKELSLLSISLIINHLPIVIQQPNDKISRQKMLIASSFAGLAFSQTRTTACHAISYPLTLHFSIDHGIACVMTLPDVMEINMEKVKEIKEIKDLFNKFDGINKWLDSVCNPYYKLHLSSFGVHKSDLSSIVDECYTKGRMDNNPVYIIKKDLLTMLFNKL